MSIATRLASKSVLMFALRIFGAGLIFVVQALIARVWGAGSLGEFLLVIAAANLLAMAMPLGYQTVATYFAAQYRAKGEGRHLRRFLARAYGFIVVIGGAVALLGEPLTNLMGDAGAHLSPLWVPTALIAVATAITFVNTTVLVGLKQAFAGYLADMIFRPVVTLAVFGIVVAVADGPDMARFLWVLAIVLLVLFAVQFAFMVRAVREIPVDEPYRRAEPRRWWRFAAPWVLITLATDYFFDINLLLLAGLLEREELAIFGVTTRIFALAAFGVVAVYSLTLPEIFEAEARSDGAAFTKRLGEANLVAAGLAIALFIGVSAFGWILLSMFGDDFVAGAVPASILCLGLVVRAIFGPASLVLSIHNRPWASLPSVALGIVTLIVGNYVLVPIYGMNGAAISAFIAISIWSVALWATALIKAKVDVSLFSRFRKQALA